MPDGSGAVLTNGRLLSRVRRLASGFVGQRVAAAAFILLSTMVLARILAPEDFGRVTFFATLAKYMLMGQLGAATGYTYYYFKSRDEIEGLRFAFCYAVQLLLVAVAFAMLAPPGSIYLLAAVGFGLLIPFHVLMPIARVQRSFYVSLLPDLILYGALLLAVGVHMVQGKASSPTSLIQLALLLVPLSYLVLWRVLTPEVRKLTFSTGRFDWEMLRRYGKLLGHGLSMFMANILYTVVILSDRLFIERFHAPEALGVYMLAFQIVLGACLVQAALNTVTLVDFGAAEQEDLMRLFRSKLRKGLVVTAGAMVVIVSAAFVLQRYIYPNFDGLFETAVTLAVGYLAFTLAGAVSPNIFFAGKYKYVVASMAMVCVMTLVHNAGVLLTEADWHWLPRLTSLWLFLHAIVVILVAYRLSRRRET